MNINIFKKRFKDNFNDSFLEFSNFKDGQFGDLERLEFEYGSKIGTVDFWEKGWIEIHTINTSTQKEIFHVLLEPNEEDKIKESFDLLFEKLRE